MFQPQPTPYLPFATTSYGVREELSDYSGYPHQQPPPPQQLGLHGPNHSGHSAGALIGGGASGTSVRHGGGGRPLMGGPAIFHPTSTSSSSAAAAAFASLPPGTTTSSTTTTVVHANTLASIPPHSHYSHSTPRGHGASLRRRTTAPHLHIPASSIKMDPSVAEDLAAQEAAARDYRPNLEGPLVGEKTPSHAIAEEYAKADPIYVTKTVALPQTYSHYRPIQGDGNCGWRAIGFSYFEKLIEGGNQAQISAEMERVVQLNDFILNIGGYSPYVYEDMVEETQILYQEILSVLPNADAAMALLTAKFNNPDSANAIIYHLRLLAASWLKGNVDQYEHFIQGHGSVQAYCSEWIEPPDREIDHLCIALLFNVLLKPAGMVLEVAYLDRSEGQEVNNYRLPEEARGQDLANLGPVICLLYRPDHYDILYRPPPAPLNIQVNRATSFSHEHQITSNISSLGSFAALDISPLAMIPGFGDSGISPLAGPDASPLADPYAPSPQSPWMAQPFGPSLSQHQAATPSPPQPAMATPVGPMNHPLRFSKYNFPGMVENAPVSEQTFSTVTFKNSHFNTAHYNNPNFQPEEYRPDGEEATDREKMCGRKRSKQGSHSSSEW